MLSATNLGAAKATRCSASVVISSLLFLLKYRSYEGSPRHDVVRRVCVQINRGIRCHPRKSAGDVHAVSQDYGSELSWPGKHKFSAIVVD